MRKYETVVVFHPNLNKDGLDAEIARVKEVLGSNGAVDLTVKQWGKRELAYPAMKQKSGYFAAFYYGSDNHNAPSACGSLLRINDQVLKFQSHRIEEHQRRFKGNPRRLQGDMGDDELDAEVDEERLA